jgi:hypothetical protein
MRLGIGLRERAAGLLAAVGLLLTAPVPGAALAATARVAAGGGGSAVLPALSLQRTGARVGWTFGDAASAARAAASDRRPLVLVVTAPGCAACQALAADALRCPTFNTLAGQAHFAMTTTAEGGATGDLVRSFSVKALPTLLVLAPNPSGAGVAERARGAGDMDERTLMAVMARGGVWSKAANPLDPGEVAIGGHAPRGCLPGALAPAGLKRPAAAHVRASDGWAGLR